MDAEQVLQLLDSYWFEQKIISSSSPPSPPPPTPNLQIPKQSLTPELSCLQSRHVRSSSDELSSQTSFTSEYDSPTSVLPLPQCKLQSILSGKETPNIEEVAEKPKVERKRRNRGNSCKSLTDLEFEELKGFMDLGFAFSEEDRNTSLVLVVPGLQRLGKEEELHKGREEEQYVVVEKMVSRPYLSEAWEVRNHMKQNKNPLMMNWNFSSLSNEADMKNHLRCWAHTVATAVR